MVDIEISPPTPIPIFLSYGIVFLTTTPSPSSSVTFSPTSQAITLGATPSGVASQGATPSGVVVTSPGVSTTISFNPTSFFFTSNMMFTEEPTPATPAQGI